MVGRVAVFPAMSITRPFMVNVAVVLVCFIVVFVVARRDDFCGAEDRTAVSFRIRCCSCSCSGISVGWW